MSIAVITIFFFKFNIVTNDLSGYYAVKNKNIESSVL